MILFGLFVSVWSLVMGWKVDQGRYGRRKVKPIILLDSGERQR